jgi:hypothetical protein
VIPDCNAFQTEGQCREEEEEAEQMEEFELMMKIRSSQEVHHPRELNINGMTKEEIAICLDAQNSWT